MKRDEFLVAFSELLEAGSPLTGSEKLTDLGGWDSMTMLRFMAMIDERWGMTLAPKKLTASTTVDDLMALLC